MDDVLKIPKLIAHRGASHDFPENTICAFDEALKTSVDGIEFDVQLTHDQVPVIFHDYTVHRIGGGRHPIANFDLSQIQAMDAGIWFGNAFHGKKIPTFDDVLSRYAGKTELFIEIKDHEKFSEHRRRATLIQKVIEGVHKFSLEHHSFILCFSLDVLKIVHNIAPNLRCILNLSRLPRLTFQVKNDYSFLSGVCVRMTTLKPSFVELFHQNNQKVFTYTCNTPQIVEQAIQCNVDGIISDKPSWLVHYIQKLKGSH